MSDQFDDILETDEEQTEVPKALRDAYKRQKEENERLRQENEAFKAKVRETDLKTFVKDKGLPDKAVALIGDRDPEEWYSEYGALFGKSEEPKQETVIPPDQRQQIQAVTNVQPGVFDPGSVDELNSQLDQLESSAKTPEEFYEGLRNLGS